MAVLARVFRQAFGAKPLNLAFGLYLAALAALGFKWLSPLSWLHERATWTDALVFAAALVWLWGRLAAGWRPRPRAFHLALGAYMFAAAASAAFAADTETAAKTVLLMVELGFIALLTSAFAADRDRLDAIVWTICLVSLATALLVALGLILFYAGEHTSLLGAYGGYFVPSDRYARVAAGFYSPPLLASFCIFASAAVARDDTSLPRPLRLATQIALGVVVALTFSRGALGFAAAVAIRVGWTHRDSLRIRVLAAAVVVGSILVVGALTIGRLQLDPTRPSTVTYEVPDPHNRRETIETSLRTLGEHPILGEGPGSLPGEIRGEPFRAHVTPLNVAATMGLPALAALVLMVAVLWRNRRRPTPIATWSGLVGLAIDGLAQDIEHFRHVWVMIGLADADRRTDARRDSAPPESAVSRSNPLGGA